MKIFLLFFFLFVEMVLAVDAELDIIRKNSTIPNIAIVITKNNSDNNLAFKLKEILEKDLTTSCNFNVESMNLDVQSVENKFNFTDDAIKKYDLILLLEVKKSADNGIVVDVAFHDINTKELKSKRTYQISNLSKYPLLAHKIAISINNEIKAPPIDWMGRFIIFSRYTSSKKSEIVVSDYTLTYQKVVVNGGLNLFPKWANREQTSFYYTAYDNLYPTLIKQELYNKKSENILQSDGMLVCSDVSKDENKLLLTMAPNGQPDIYVYDLRSKISTKITRYSGIDVSGNFLANDDKIVFVSDRMGNANIFTQKIGSDNVERLVYHGKNNSQATTFNNYVIYSSREEGSSFNLYLISTENTAIKKLTTQGTNQFPKFSIDGESVLYINNKNGNSSLGVIRLSNGKHFLFPLKSGKIQSIDW
ncbi:MAG: Tol-Pal system protein TolB [Epsilonproteobacteria bacterium]|nr:Tol-Pal system protein TolB [Campylobacterota bacterium]